MIIPDWIRLDIRGSLERTALNWQHDWDWHDQRSYSRGLVPALSFETGIVRLQNRWVRKWIKPWGSVSYGRQGTFGAGRRTRRRGWSGGCVRAPPSDEIMSSDGWERRAARDPWGGSFSCGGVSVGRTLLHRRYGHHAATIRAGSELKSCRKCRLGNAWTCSLNSIRNGCYMMSG